MCGGYCYYVTALDTVVVLCYHIGYCCCVIFVNVITVDRQYIVLGLGLSHWILLLYYRVGIYCCCVITLDNAVVSYLLMSSQWTDSIQY